MEKVTSRILTLVESLLTSSVADQGQTHPRAERLQDENGAVQTLFMRVLLQAGIFVLLGIGGVQALTFDG